jgi:dUTP pyrophosphatase
MIAAAVPPEVKQESITNLVRVFEDQGYTRAKAQSALNVTKQELNNYINSLNPSSKQQTLLNNLLNNFYEIFDAAIEQYHNYNIILPIKLGENAISPTYAHPTDAGADLYAAETITIPAHSLSNMIKTNVHIALPEGWAALVVPRSSIGLKTGLRLSNSIGLIDEEYRGQIGVIYDNISDSDYTINVGDRIAQLIVIPAYHFKPEIVSELSSSDRGEDGFGSSGK